MVGNNNNEKKRETRERQWSRNSRINNEWNSIRYNIIIVIIWVVESDTWIPVISSCVNTNCFFLLLLLCYGCILCGKGNDERSTTVVLVWFFFPFFLLSRSLSSYRVDGKSHWNEQSGKKKIFIMSVLLVGNFSDLHLSFVLLSSCLVRARTHSFAD